MIAPYYRDSETALYQIDCLRLLPEIAKYFEIGLVLTDPPYGIAERTDRGEKGRGGWVPANNFDAVVGDGTAYDPTPLLRFPRLCIFGANYFAHLLPSSPSWLVWDKLNGLTSRRSIGFNDNADFELAWTNLGGPARIITHRWLGLLKDTEKGHRRVHPTQKPVALMTAIILEYTKPGDWILDPYMGAGATILAARRTGRKAIGIEIEPAYCEITLSRLKAELPRRS
jgi:site-specific DNA-methyltransferase (adenine-specific)